MKIDRPMNLIMWPTGILVLVLKEQEWNGHWVVDAWWITHDKVCPWV